MARHDPKTPYYYNDPSLLGSSGHLNLTLPRVSVFDPDGNLPLVLQRNALATPNYPFHEELFSNVIRDLAAYLLVDAPTHPFDGKASGYRRWYPGVASRSRSIAPSFHFCSAKDGLYPADEWHVKQGGFHRFLLVGGLTSSGKAAPQLPPEGTEGGLIIPVPDPSGRQRYRDWIRFALCGGARGAVQLPKDLRRCLPTDAASKG